MFHTSQESHSTPIIPVTSVSLNTWLDEQEESVKSWVTLYDFTAKPNKHLCVPDQNSRLHCVLIGYDAHIADMWMLSTLATQLPAGQYHLHPDYTGDITSLTIGWGLAHYRFDQYKEKPAVNTSLYLPENVEKSYIEHVVQATRIVRDLINTPAGDLGPTELAEAAQAIASECDASCTITAGDELLTQHYPAIHAVGRASDNPPCLIDLQWGNPEHPAITLVGKGVTFDTGGLDIKPLSGMKLMKKDMGGAAHVLGLAYLIMREQLPLRLRVLIPAVENAVSSNAYRPQDVIDSRKGSTIEIISTDAEGRVILADALYEAASQKPELIIDFATLTGAARVALGTEVPALFSNDNTVAKDITNISMQQQDALWHMPLWQDYKRYIESNIADICNTPSSPTGGAISAALFLEHFVQETPWVHIDLMAWNNNTRPGRPKGGEAMGMRAVYHYLHNRFPKKN